MSFLFCAGALFCTLLPSTAFEEDEHSLLSKHLLEYETNLLNRSAQSIVDIHDPELFGGDPFRIHRLPGINRYLVLLRSSSRVVLTDALLNPLDTKPVPASPTGWAVIDGRLLVVSGELSHELYFYEIVESSLRKRGVLSVNGIAGVRDIAYVPHLRSLFLLDEFDRRLAQVRLPKHPQDRNGLDPRFYFLGAGPLAIRYAGGHLLVNLLLEHTLIVLPLTDEGPNFNLASRIVHDGPIWSFDAVVRHDSLLIAAAGVENRPLDRRQGEFGYVDSFLFMYDLPKDPATGIFAWKPDMKKKRSAQANLSEIGVVTPKAIRFEPFRDTAKLWVSGFGAETLALFQVSEGSVRPRLESTRRIPPGTTDFALESHSEETTLILTNSLLDQLYRVDSASYSAMGDSVWPQANASRESRIGELLFFTTLLTPNNQTNGPLSRFTCETCHYEGTFDGRVHYTGRGRVFATTKTLRGLANNVPLFSRAGDRSLASMVIAEFQAANQGRQDAFSIKVSDFPWLRAWEGLPAILTPIALRESFLSFFVDFKHRPNPFRSRPPESGDTMERGLKVFRDRCAYCHLPLVSTRTGESVPLSGWREWLEDKWQDLVWGAPFYTKTNIQPYVHEAGARVPSLRRVVQKYPYFTDGSSRTLVDVLRRFRYQGATAWHHYEENTNGAETPKSLTADEIAYLETVLRYF